MFKEINENCKSVILTSGTLSPMDSFASELSMPFPIKLEATHVIDRSQVWVGVIPMGPSGMITSGVFKNLDSFQFQDEVGTAIYRYLSIIPHGVLCFVPSYSFLKKLIQRWTNTGLFSKMNLIKPVLIEPQNASGNDFKSILNEFYHNIEKSRITAKKNQNDSGGCLLLAVYRGKISEGLDFIDDNARAVIAVGIPFPNLKDIQVNLKRNYNDIFSSKKGLLSGQQWYECQAFRATNQALGRCIRHRNDWGAIILMDQRYSIPKNLNQLSKWVRQSAVVYSSFDESFSSLKQFMDYSRKKNLCEEPLIEASTSNEVPKSNKENILTKNGKNPVKTRSKYFIKKNVSINSSNKTQ